VSMCCAMCMGDIEHIQASLTVASDGGRVKHAVAICRRCVGTFTEMSEADKIITMAEIIGVVSEMRQSR